MFLMVASVATLACTGTSDNNGDASASLMGGAGAIGTGGQQSSGGTGAHSSSGGNGGLVVASGGAGGGGSGGIAANSTGGSNPADSGTPWYCDEFSTMCLCDHTQIDLPIGCKMKWSCCYQNKTGVPYCDCQELDAATCAGFEGPGNTGARIVPNCNQ